MPNPNDEKSTVTQKAIQGTFWSYLSYTSGKLLSFVTTIILARLLIPEDFGLLGYCMVAIQYLEVVNTLGMGTALISRRDKVAAAANAGFVISFVLGIGLYGLAWISAPAIATYFKEPAVTELLRLLALVLPISGLGAIPGAFIERNLAFRIKFVPDVSRSLTKGLLSIILAWQGFGVWSLVWGQVIGAIVATILNWVMARWRPERIYDRRVTTEMLQFGGHIIAIGFIGALLNNVDYLIVGRILGAAALGYYTLAYRMPELIIRSINLVVGRVAHPVLSKLQWDDAGLRSVYGNYLRYTALVIFPAGVGLALLAAPIIELFYTAEWTPAIPVMRWIALSITVASMGHIPGVLYKAINRPDILNKLAVIKLPLTIVTLWYSTRWGIEGVAFGHLILAFIKVILDTVVAGRMISFNLLAVLKALQPALLGTAGMSGVILLLLVTTQWKAIYTLGGGILIGFFVYCGLLLLTIPSPIMVVKGVH